MDCEQFSALIDAALLGDIVPDEQRKLAAHLAACPRCRTQSEELRAALGLASGQAAGTQMAALKNRILAAGRTELPVARPRSNRRVWHYALPLASAAAILMAVVHWPGGEASLSGEDCACGNAWQFVGGDAANSRHFENASVRMPAKVLWEKTIPGSPGSYKPLAWKNLVIVGTLPPKFSLNKGGGLLALDAGSGQIRWQKTFTEGDYYKSKGFPDRCLLGGRLYVTDGRVCRVFDAGSGQETACFAAPNGADGWSYLAADKSRLFGVSRDGSAVFCVNRASGAALWSRATGGQTSVPALAGNRLYLQTSSGDLTALDAVDGREIWRKEKIAPGGKASVCATASRVLVLSEKNELAGFDTATGERQWEHKIPFAYQAGLAAGSEAAYILAGRAAIALTDGRLLWQHAEAIGGLCTPPTVAGERLLTSTGKTAGSLNVLSASGVALNAIADASNQACDGAIVSNGRVFTASSGRFMALTAQ